MFHLGFIHARKARGKFGWAARTKTSQTTPDGRLGSQVRVFVNINVIIIIITITITTTACVPPHPPRMGPNDVSGVVWVLGIFFKYNFCVFCTN